MKPYTRVISSDHTGTVEVDQVPIVNDNGSQLDSLYGVKVQTTFESSGPLTEEMIIKAVEKIRSGSFKSNGMASAEFPFEHPFNFKAEQNKDVYKLDSTRMFSPDLLKTEQTIHNYNQGLDIYTEYTSNGISIISASEFKHKQNLCKEDSSISKSDELNENDSQLSKS